MRNSDFDKITFEGVVGKSGGYDDLTLVKCKTNNWFDAIKRL